MTPEAKKRLEARDSIEIMERAACEAGFDDIKQVHKASYQCGFQAAWEMREEETKKGYVTVEFYQMRVNEAVKAEQERLSAKLDEEIKDLKMQGFKSLARVLFCAKAGILNPPKEAS